MSELVREKTPDGGCTKRINLVLVEEASKAAFCSNYKSYTNNATRALRPCDLIKGEVS
jgi:hypothetical protein